MGVFTISGMYKGREVDVIWDDGVVIADDDVLATIDDLRLSGRLVNVTPTGPAFPAGTAAAAPAYLTICEAVQVTAADGDLPVFYPDEQEPEGRVY